MASLLKTRESSLPKTRESSVNKYSVSEVGKHDQAHDCWIVINNRVYDVTNYLYEHPGGSNVILPHAGHDCTHEFEEIHHSKGALTILREYEIGEVQH